MTLRRLAPAVLVLAVGMSSIATAASAKTLPWAGLGGTLKAWAQVHGVTHRDCDSGCYGDRVLVAGEYANRFITVEATTYGVVNGFQLAIGDGTPMSIAERAVSRLLPADAVTTGSFVEHDSYGDTCLLWNLKSKTLQTLMGTTRYQGKTHFIDPGGVVGVAMEDDPASSSAGLTSVGATVANAAIVQEQVLTKTDGC